MTGTAVVPPMPGWESADRTWTHTPRLESQEVRMLLSFQRPSRSSREGAAFREVRALKPRLRFELGRGV